MYPIYFVTGVGFADSAESQKMWQDLTDRNEAKLLASWAARKKTDKPKSGIVRRFIEDNLYIR